MMISYHNGPQNKSKRENDAHNTKLTCNNAYSSITCVSKELKFIMQKLIQVYTVSFNSTNKSISESNSLSCIKCYLIYLMCKWNSETNKKSHI